MSALMSASISGIQGGNFEQLLETGAFLGQTAPLYVVSSGAQSSFIETAFLFSACAFVLVFLISLTRLYINS